MKTTKTYPANWFNAFTIHAYRLVLGRVLPQSMMRDKIPHHTERKAVDGKFTLEIVSHCWGYANLLTYQLSSFVNHPPTQLTLIVTVFYALEDTNTAATIAFFEKINIPNVSWNFHVLPKGKLFARAIGRNMAARSTRADWVWFTDCDIVFHKNCLDSLAQSLQGETGLLFFPKEERTTQMLRDSDPMLRKNAKTQIVDIDAEQFNLYARDKTRNKARGPFQIVHADVARAIGYCDKLFMFQTQARHWRKCYEDTAFRWLLGTNGESKPIEGVYHIQHVTKGRYAQNSLFSRLRSSIRLRQK